MRTAKFGDKVHIHFVGRLQRGHEISSRSGIPLQMTVGVDHPRLPGLGLALVGLAVGERATVQVAPEQAFGVADPSRVRSWSRKRFPANATLQVGSRVKHVDAHGRTRSVRIRDLREGVVVVDTNHRWAGQSLRLEVEILGIVDAAAAGSESADLEAATPVRNLSRVLAFDVDPVSLATFHEALPERQIDVFYRANPASLSSTWDPGSADLLVVGLRLNVTETLALCRFLAFCTSYSKDSGTEGPRASKQGTSGPDTPQRADPSILLLVPAGQDELVEAALEAGVHRCLMLPISAPQVASVAEPRPTAEQPSRHTLNLEVARTVDRWRDDGGQG